MRESGEVGCRVCSRFLCCSKILLPRGLGEKAEEEAEEVEEVQWAELEATALWNPSASAGYGTCPSVSHPFGRVYFP